jgi:hypothetical protein
LPVEAHMEEMPGFYRLMGLKLITEDIFNLVPSSKKLTKSLFLNFSTQSKKLRDTDLFHFLRIGPN